jgi:uncharacterized membrane protein YraQ (UPF0718 family)
MSNLDDEPSLEKIDDFNDNESPEKRNTVRLVVIGLLIAGAVFVYFKSNSPMVEEYVGTEEKPGISTSKGK